jgi:hypothetical protein
MNRLAKVSQDRWNEIFEAGANYDGEQLFIDFDRGIQIGKPIPSLASSIYYDKKFLANLKAATPFASIASKKSLPSIGEQMKMYPTYPTDPIGLEIW